MFSWLLVMVHHFTFSIIYLPKEIYFNVFRSLLPNGTEDGGTLVPSFNPVRFISSLVVALLGDNMKIF